VARARIKGWKSVAVGVALGASTLAGGTPAQATAGQEISRNAPRTTQVHAALNSGIDCYRRGEYDTAARFFEQAELGKDQLTADERQELGNLLRLNRSALKAQHEGGQVVRQVADAVMAGRNADAEELLKSLVTNQFLLMQDRERAAGLAEKLGIAPIVFRGQEEKYVHPLLIARGKLQHSRQLIAKGNYDAAETLAKEVEQLDVNFHTGEDTPRKVLDDLARIKRDPKKLLVAARVAFQCGDLDQAERLAQMAQKATSSWNVSVFGDNPGKVLKDVNTVRAKLVKDSAKKPEIVAEKAPAKAENAKEMLKLGRGALERGNLEEANQYLAKSQAKDTTFYWWEDSPKKLAADVKRAEKKQQAVASKQPAAEVTPAAASAPAESEAKAILREARDLFNAGNVEEAEQRAQVAQASGQTDWGLFDDSPEKLITDIRKSQKRHQRDEAVRTLAEARRLFDKGEIEESFMLAQRAEQMYGAAGLWDTGDRPAFLLAEISAAQARRGNQETQVAPAAHVASPESAGPAIQTDNAPTFNPPVPPPVPQAPAQDATKQKAAQLLTEARQMQKEGRFVEARVKALDAQKLGASFIADEDQPERALLQLADAANKRIEQLLQTADDMAATAMNDATRFQTAETIILEARRLAVGFALDTQPIDAKMSFMHRSREHGKIAPISDGGNPRVAPSAPGQDQTTSPPAAQPGNDLLEKARLELKQGDLETARRLAVEVYNGPFNMTSQADAVLHSIDAEEFNRKIQTAHRTFEAGVNAFVNKNHDQAMSVLRTVDAGLLPPDKQAKLKELLATAEVRPAAAVEQTPAQPAAEMHAEPAKVAPTESAPMKAADSQYSKQVQAMQEIQFQKLRDEGLKAQRDASERFRNGETVQALEILQDYLNSLKDSQVDPERLALLQRPIESRLQGFKKIKAQMDFEKERTGSAQAFQTVMQREAKLEEHKKKQVDELMEKYHQLFSEAKYADAEMVAAQALELDPNNASVSAAVKIAEMQKNSTAYQGIKKGREKIFVEALNDAENYGPPVTSKDPLKYDDERWATIKNRKQFPKEGWNLQTKSEKELEIERRLSLPISLDFKDQSLRNVLEDLRDMTNINIVPDMPALDAENISLDRPITMHIEGVTTKSALNLILHHAKLIYVIKDEVLVVTTEAHARGKLISKSHPVADLVIPVENAPLGTTLTQQLERINNSQGVNGGQTTPFLGGNTLRNGANVSNTGAGMANMTSSPAGSGAADSAPPPPLHDTLIRLITSTIKPESWSNMGGPGTIQFWPLGMSLVINQTPDIQEQVAELLAALRRLQDVQVAVEVRFISLSEAFYERIGLDFNVNFMTRNTKYEPLIVSQQFQPAGFNNTFRPSNFVTGLVPGGSRPPGVFTGDLNIPLLNSSFAPSVPPFGGFPNSLGLDGGLSLGLAFLSDIQVFMFMEAAQADRRTSVMQAPKLTLFNGQTSTITIATQQFFVTNIQAWQINGQVIYAPQNQAFQIGFPNAPSITLAIQAVISADRRYVRLNMNPNLNALASPTTALFPITAFITPTFDNGVQGQPIPFTQYVQQPNFSNISIQTTVLVPDGGTVIMGGLKALREGRNEFGPPILSKLPYVNRLFKNVGYGKETESMLIMVTPRVIINEEEEALLGTGGGRAIPSGGELDFLRRGVPALLDRGAGEPQR